MKKLLFIILILNYLVACSQGKENKTYYENGNLKEHNYLDENGEVTGEWKAYYESGKLLKTGNIENGKLEGEVKEYYENGNLMSITNYQNGLENGEWKYYNENGTLNFIMNAKNGIKHGEFKHYLDGKLETIDIYVNGERTNGKEFHKNGKLLSEGSYKDGKEDGEWRYYNDKGKLVSIGNYQNGKKVGEWKGYYFEDETLSELEIYKNGEVEELQLYNGYGQLMKTYKYEKEQ
ncbi:hypothetical protein LUD75_01750 [Epilithonimonas sp. JDS]|uniref:toxin-antitoxin system YwqK family antitoxin n=1 Tax=Epilithonimonas sp. JDS TaxID=2902797 RepID=UPI001E44D78D|nr:toxin-antitoxin system YwqK family antitoxin [Epilithonimonas sp. JDS]MCD9853411.1 hypothetical protein [Epilithonimonas sp. JDS]